MFSPFLIQNKKGNKPLLLAEYYRRSANSKGIMSYNKPASNPIITITKHLYLRRCFVV